MKVFICCWPTDEREALRDAVLSRWQDLNAEIIGLFPSTPMERKEFQWQRRQQAEQTASFDYILADDDALPIGPDFIELGGRALANHPGFGMLSARDIFQTFEPMLDFPFEDDDLIERNSVGLIRFIRKGAVKRWREPYERDSSGRVRRYDMEHADNMRENGFKAGLLKHVFADHVGRNSSTI